MFYHFQPQISVPPEAEPIAEVDVEDDILFSLKQAEALLNATKEGRKLLSLAITHHISVNLKKNLFTHYHENLY
jgi:hypothetical protein